MRRWYYRLRSSDDNDKKQRALLDHERPGPKSLVICQELKYRQYSNFDNFFEFGAFCHQEVVPANRCFYEIIFGEQSQKPYFDMDIPFRKEGTPADQFALTPAEAEAAAKKLEACILEVSKASPHDLMKFSSHGTEKLSFHLVLDNWCVSNAQEAKGFFQQVMTIFPAVWKSAVDDRMYKTIQQFRTYGSHKYGKDRVKILHPETTWELPVIPKHDRQKFMLILGASLITNTSYCQVLPSFAAYLPVKPVYKGPGIKLKEQQASYALQLLKQSRGDAPFQIKEIQGGIVSLKRLRPSFCDACQRIHENEHPYLYVVGEDYRVYFDCRRNGENKKTFLGCLPITEPIVAEPIPEESPFPPWEDQPKPPSPPPSPRPQVNFDKMFEKIAIFRTAEPPKTPGRRKKILQKDAIQQQMIESCKHHCRPK